MKKSYKAVCTRCKRVLEVTIHSRKGMRYAHIANTRFGYFVTLPHELPVLELCPALGNTCRHVTVTIERDPNETDL